ncbi:hypothetical protein M3Y98_00693600 [Aphelenchoides besseyi]|nr:hypothetical protein M3Y98_00693600 [Aphelenchoides besseyi]KAI6208966.1 hypothetical protein M3Y96_00170800 [Aphelenchoides besseyi]
MKYSESTSEPELNSPVHSAHTLNWVFDKEVKTADGVRVIVRKAVEQPESISYILKTPNGKRFVYQRTDGMVMLMSSNEKDGTTRFITCNLASNPSVGCGVTK